VRQSVAVRRRDAQGESEHDPRIEYQQLGYYAAIAKDDIRDTARMLAESSRPLQRSSSSRPALALEAHRSMPDLSPSASGTGYASTFARAGFKTVTR